MSDNDWTVLTPLKDIKSALKEHLEELKGVNARQASITKTIKRLKELEAFHNLRPVISEHALIRYLERVKGIDIDKLRAEILTDDIIKLLNTGTGKIKISGTEFIVKDKKILTTI